MILAFVSQKGGGGKTTLCVNMAAYQLSLGKKVVVIDLDPQASATSWGAIRDDSLKVVSCHPPFLEKTIQDYKQYDFILIDTPAALGDPTTKAINVCDFVVFPVKPSSFDLISAQATINLINNNKKPAGAIINAIQSRTNVANDAEDFLIEHGIKILGQVGLRVDIQHAAALGKGIIETNPNSKAAKELIYIFKSIKTRMK